MVCLDECRALVTVSSLSQVCSALFLLQPVSYVSYFEHPIHPDESKNTKPCQTMFSVFMSDVKNVERHIQRKRQHELDMCDLEDAGSVNMV